MRQTGIKLGEILVEDGLLTRGQLDLALEIQKAKGDFLGDILLQKEWLSEGQLSEALSKQFELPFISLDFEEIEWEVPRHYATLMIDQLCFPCTQDSSSVTVAIFNPLDVWTMSRVDSQAKGRHVKLVLATKTRINEAIMEFRKRSLSEKKEERG